MEKSEGEIKSEYFQSWSGEARSVLLSWICRRACERARTCLCLSHPFVHILVVRDDTRDRPSLPSVFNVGVYSLSTGRPRDLGAPWRLCSQRRSACTKFRMSSRRGLLPRANSLSKRAPAQCRASRGSKARGVTYAQSGCKTSKPMPAEGPRGGVTILIITCTAPPA